MVHSQHGDPVNTKCLFFLDIGQMPAASQESIQFHMVNYGRAIKASKSSQIPCRSKILPKSH